MENSFLYQIRCFQEFSIFFYQNHGSFSKNPKWRPFQKDIFIATKGLFYMKNITKHHFKAYFEEK